MANAEAEPCRNRVETNSELECDFSATVLGYISAEVPRFRSTSRIASRGSALARSEIRQTIHILDLTGIAQSQRVWCIPAARMKNRRGGDHEVPLSPRCIAILEQLAEIRSGDRIFPIGPHAMWNWLKAKYPNLTIHGLRSTFRDWCGDVAAADIELAELALHHAVGNRVTRAYRRGKALERRRHLMEQWQAFCETPFKSNVTILSDRAA